VRDGRNVVAFLDNPPRQAFDELTLAITFQITDTRTNLFDDVDVIFNDRDIDWESTTGPFSVSAVSLHEIGHFIGLDHTNDLETVMFPTAQGLTQLSRGDRSGAIALYPTLFTPPVAALQVSPASGPAPLEVAFSSDGSLSPGSSTLSFNWEFGDGASSTDPNPTHVYSAPGVYSARLTVRDLNGSSGTDTTIRVTDAQAPIAVEKFRLSASLIENDRDSDRLSLTLGGVSPAAGDQILLSLGEMDIGRKSAGGNVPEFIPLDAAVSFRGHASPAGELTIRFDARNRLLIVSFTGASLNRLDPRSLDDVSQSGIGTLPLRLFVRRADGTSVSHESEFAFAFTVRSGKVAGGFVEKSIVGKK